MGKLQDLFTDENFFLIQGLTLAPLVRAKAVRADIELERTHLD